jgi:hypothetical protein
VGSSLVEPVPVRAPISDLHIGPGLAIPEVVAPEWGDLCMPVSVWRVSGDVGGSAEELLCRADEPGVGWRSVAVKVWVKAVRARPAQDGRRLGVLDVERARRLAAGEDIAGVQGKRMGGPVAGGHVAAVAKQDLVQIVALLVAVEDRIDARVELCGPVRDWVGGGADAVSEFVGELVVQRGQPVVLGAEVQVEQSSARRGSGTRSRAR